MPSTRIIVIGRVQGVGFRFYTAREAQRHGIDGEVWNRIDGRVEVVASHQNPVVLEQFVEALRGGPGRVDDVIVEEGPPAPAGFQIGPTR